MKYTITNASPKRAVTVTLQQDGLWGDTRIESESQPMRSTRPNADMAEWQVSMCPPTAPNGNHRRIQHQPTEAQRHAVLPHSSWRRHCLRRSSSTRRRPPRMHEDAGRASQARRSMCRSQSIAIPTASEGGFDLDYLGGFALITETRRVLS